jgi:uncharacterized protein with ParB-like and HNH nuclease domain
MSYQTAKTIADVIGDIHKKKYLLPSIQREFVWKPFQIERLFDSLMRDYPISSFLFWVINKENLNKFQFYEFLRDYHERHQKHNPKANVGGEEGVTAVLDGQQRLTSIYIGLKGSYAYKTPRKRWDNDLAYPKRKLYVNLITPTENIDLKYDFRFLTEEEAKIKDNITLWFRVGEILDLKEAASVNRYLIENRIFYDYGEEQANFANDTLSKLHSIIHIKPTISYYLETSSKLDKVLNIFIRINSGGTELSHSDLLLSIASAQWEKLDAREEITNFVDEINNIGNGFKFNKDFVLKTSLVLSDFSGIAFKVDNFNKTNMLEIESKWSEITKAIRLSINLVSGYGYNRDTLSSTNALIPIAYYLLKIGLPENFEKSNNTIEDRGKILRWLSSSLLKRTFSGQPDNILRQTRTILKNENGMFPINEITEFFKGTNKTLIFSNEDIDNLLLYKYGQSYTFPVLAFLYPSFDFRNRFHIDHIFPKSEFTNSKLRKRGVPENDIPDFLDNVNRIGNLQLLEDIPNMEKQNKDFGNWFLEVYSTDINRLEYKNKHLIPETNLELLNFKKFFEFRNKLIRERFKRLLQNNYEEKIQETG